jgi:flavodoxin
VRILVVYDSAYGNTERVARSIGDALADAGPVEVRSVADATAGAIPTAGVDLLVVGGPTQRHGASPALVAWLASLPVDDLAGVAAAVFDTRYRMAKLISGSAGESVARWLRRAGCRLVGPPESFFVAKDAPPEGHRRRHELEGLEMGEVERAAAWARDLPAAL